MFIACYGRILQTQESAISVANPLDIDAETCVYGCVYLCQYVCECVSLSV